MKDNICGKHPKYYSFKSELTTDVIRSYFLAIGRDSLRYVSDCLWNRRKITLPINRHSQQRMSKYS